MDCITLKTKLVYTTVLYVFILAACQPIDKFEPNMPNVDSLSDMDALFAQARNALNTGCPPDQKTDSLPEGTRCIAVITPDRNTVFVPGITPGSLSTDDVAVVYDLLPSEEPLHITVISYTDADALTENIGKCIPFLGYLYAFSYVGHNVVVFEGHPSAFESGVRNSDVLLVDSAMLPLIQDEWLEVAYEVMNPNPKVLLHDRETYSLYQIES